MKLSYDPADNEAFWSALHGIPGYPEGEEIPLRTILVESGALFRLPEVLEKASPNSKKDILVVMDATPMRRSPEDLKLLILRLLRDAGWTPRPLVLLPDIKGEVHTDMAHIGGVKTRVQAGIPVLSIGSGVVTDITKHACFLFEKETGAHIPYVVYQTANSVSAYASNMAPVFIDGVKRTLPSRYPDAIVSDLETLRDAPHEMTAAGVGDMLAIFISFPDWYLAHRLGMDPHYQELPQFLLAGMDEILLDYSSDIRLGDLQGMAVLSKLIHIGGLCMSLTHATTPMSGYEHVISHYLDLMNEKAGRPLAIHGSLVGVSTLVCSQAYRIFLEEFNPQDVRPDDCFPDMEEMRHRLFETIAQVDPSGRAGEECWRDYQLLLERWSEQRASLERFLTDWPNIKVDLQKLSRSPEVIRKIMQNAGLSLRFADLTPPVSKDDARSAFLNAPYTRRRLTLGDLLIFLNWDRQALWERVAANE